MLDEFELEQPIAYRIIKNSLKNNTLSHAYLFGTNEYKNSNHFIMSFVKTLLCPNKANNDNCKNCSVCEKIDKNIYSEFKVIERDGMWIKKEQLLELQKEFKTKSVESNLKVYVINNAEYLNQSSANSLLKFLEEPQDNIIAILVTNNIHQLLDTIVSRCQVISLINSENNNIKKNISSLLEENDNVDKIIENALDFIYFYENNHIDTIVYMKDTVLNNFEDRRKIEILLQIMILFYKDLLNYKLDINKNLFNLKDIEKIAKLNNVNQIENKINIIMETKKNLKLNANINLLMDKLVMDLEGEVYE